LPLHATDLKRYHYYVYYRVRPGCEADARTRVCDLLAAVDRSTGVSGRLLSKRDEPNLWMEVYADVPRQVGFDALLDELAGQVGIANVLLPGSVRKVECFRE
jgi:hypothetical protein